jgi:hypothetical protein
MDVTVRNVAFEVMMCCCTFAQSFSPSCLEDITCTLLLMAHGDGNSLSLVWMYRKLGVVVAESQVDSDACTLNLSIGLARGENKRKEDEMS